MKKLKAKTCKKERFSERVGGVKAGVENGAMLTTFIQIYFRIHHFVVKFSKFSSLRRQGGIDPPLTKILQTPLGVATFNTLRHVNDQYYQSIQRRGHIVSDNRQEQRTRQNRIWPYTHLQKIS